MNPADLMRAAADRIEEKGWWDGSPGSPGSSPHLGDCALTSLTNVRANLMGRFGKGWTYEQYISHPLAVAECEAKRFMTEKVRALGYENEDAIDACHVRPAVAVWNDAHDKDFVVKHMRRWADEWEQENCL